MILSDILSKSYHKVSVAGVTAVLIKQHGAGSCDGRLKMKNYNHETLLFLRSYILLGVAPPRGALVDEAQTLAAVENAEEEESGVLHHALRKREYQDKGFFEAQANPKLNRRRVSTKFLCSFQRKFSEFSKSHPTFIPSQLLGAPKSVEVKI